MKVDIKQIFYRNKQRAFMDPDLGRYNNVDNPNPEWHEYHVFLSNYEELNFSAASYYGFVSWKFGLKTSINGKDFLSFIGNNPGYDVYFINPFPEYTYLFRSVWAQGEHYHPGVLEMAEQIYTDLGYSFDFRGVVNGESDAAYCNYWVGNKRFWDRYIAYTRPIHDHIKNSLTGNLKKKIHTRADEHINASYVTFIMERVFSTLLSAGDVKYLSFPYSEEFLKKRYGEIYKHLPVLRALKQRELAGTLSGELADVTSHLRESLIDFKRLSFDFESYRTPNRELVSFMKRKLRGLAYWG